MRLSGSACALPLTHDVHDGLNGCVSACVSFSQTRKFHKVWGLAPVLPRQEFFHHRLDLQQLVARLRHHAWTNNMIFANFAILQLVHMSSAHPSSPARTHDFVNFVNFV